VHFLAPPITISLAQSQERRHDPIATISHLRKGHRLVPAILSKHLRKPSAMKPAFDVTNVIKKMAENR
jgi:hypothetical protein